MKTFTILPVVTEKSMQLAAAGQFQFIVPTWATKQAITSMISQHYNVTVVGAQTATIKPRTVVFRRHRGQQAGYKKITVRLKADQTIPEFNLPKETETPTSSGNARTADAAQTEPPAAKSRVTVRRKGEKAKES